MKLVSEYRFSTNVYFKFQRVKAKERKAKERENTFPRDISSLKRKTLKREALENFDFCDSVSNSFVCWEITSTSGNYHTFQRVPSAAPFSGAPHLFYLFFWFAPTGKPITNLGFQIAGFAPSPSRKQRH